MMDNNNNNSHQSGDNNDAPENQGIVGTLIDFQNSEKLRMMDDDIVEENSLDKDNNNNNNNSTTTTTIVPPKTSNNSNNTVRGKDDNLGNVEMVDMKQTTGKNGEVFADSSSSSSSSNLTTALDGLGLGQKTSMETYTSKFDEEGYLDSNGLTKEVLAALYVREAIVGREYWVDDLRKGREPELQKLRPLALRIYTIYHWGIFRVLFDVAVWMHVLLTLWEAPYPAISTEIYGAASDVYKNGCDPNNSALPAMGVTPVAVKIGSLVIVLFYVLDFFTLMPCLGVNRFFTNKWNMLRAVLTFLQLIEVFLLFVVPGYSSYQVFRPIRTWLLITNSRSLRQQLVSVGRTVVKLGNFFALLMGFLTICSIIAVQMQQSLVDSMCPQTGSDVNATSLTHDQLQACSDIVSTQNVRSWPYAMIALMVLITSENYPDVMYPSMILNVATMSFFVVFITLGMWIIMNVLLAVMFDAYKMSMKQQILDTREVERLYMLGAFKLICGDKTVMTAQQFGLLIDELKPNLNDYRKRLFFEFLDANGGGTIDIFEFFDIPQILNLDIKKKTRDKLAPGCFKGTPFGKKLSWLCQHPNFEFCITGVILSNILLMMVQTSVEDGSAVANVADHVDTAILLCFVAEMVLKLMAYGKNYFLRTSNIFDFTLVLSSVIPFMLQVAIGTSSSIVDPSILRIFRILRLPRLLRLFSTMKQLKILISLFFRIFKPLYSIALFMAVILYSFAVIGMSIFGCSYHDQSNPFAGFFNVIVASLSCFQLLTMSNWQTMMYAAMDATGNDWTSIYFCVFVIVMSYLMLNIVIALVIEAFQMESFHVATAKENPSEEELDSFNKESSFKVLSVGDEKIGKISNEEIYSGKNPVYRVRMKRRFSRELVKRSDAQNAGDVEMVELEKLSSITGVDLPALKKEREEEGEAPNFISLAQTDRGVTVITKPKSFDTVKRRQSRWEKLRRFGNAMLATRHSPAAVRLRPRHPQQQQQPSSSSEAHGFSPI